MMLSKLKRYREPYPKTEDDSDARGWSERKYFQMRRMSNHIGRPRTFKVSKIDATVYLLFRIKRIPMLWDGMRRTRWVKDVRNTKLRRKREKNKRY